MEHQVPNVRKAGALVFPKNLHGLGWKLIFFVKGQMHLEQEKTKLLQHENL